MWAAKVLVQGALAYFAYQRAGLPLRWQLLPLFELYTLGLSVCMVGFWTLGGAVEWKGRRYE